jgi:hypothetical protein
MRRYKIVLDNAGDSSPKVIVGILASGRAVAHGGNSHDHRDRPLSASAFDRI